MAFLKLIRYSNLGIVLLTQFLFYYFITQVFQNSFVEPLLDLPHFILLAFTTLIIAASGYIINDLMDYKIDLINRPGLMPIGNGISITKARLLYLVLVISGGLIALYLALHIRNIGLFFIYPIAVLLLWLYSKHLKKQPFSGNVVVALFTAFVPGIVWFAERAGFSALTSAYGIQMQQLFLFYMSFAFSSTLFREVIKDLEDIEGDRQYNCRTLPIVLGLQKAKNLSLLIGLFLLSSIIYWIFSQWDQLRLILLILTVILLFVPTAFVLFNLSGAKTKNDFRHSSQITKLVMLAGLVYLFLFLILN